MNERERIIAQKISAILGALIIERIKSETATMVEAGCDFDQINDALPRIIGRYVEWQHETLRQVLLMDILEPPQHQSDGVTPFKPS
jgi:hypothetical protein